MNDVSVLLSVGLLFAEQSAILVLALLAALFLFLLIIGRISRMERSIKSLEASLEEYSRVLRRESGPGREEPWQSEGGKAQVVAVDALREALETLQVEVARVGDEVRRRFSSQSSAPPSGGDSPVSVRDQILARLGAEGFDQVIILTGEAGDASELPLDPSLDPSLESGTGVSAMRGGVTYKGQVIVRNGRVEDISLKPCYGAFP